MLVPFFDVNLGILLLLLEWSVYTGYRKMDQDFKAGVGVEGGLGQVVQGMGVRGSFFEHFHRRGSGIFTPEHRWLPVQ
jgi:hypothetical protein